MKGQSNRWYNTSKNEPHKQRESSREEEGEDMNYFISKFIEGFVKTFYMSITFICFYLIMKQTVLLDGLILVVLFVAWMGMTIDLFERKENSV